LIADVTPRKLAEPEVHQPQIDTLTGLGNRLALMDRLRHAGIGFKRLTLAVFDIDRFKSVNFSLGQEGADAVLRGVAARLSQNFPPPAVCYRLSGDAFAVLTANEGSGDDAAFGQAVLDAMKAAFAVKGRDVFLPASVGVAAARDAQNPQDLFDQAEAAMVRAKQEGGNCFRFHTAVSVEQAPSPSAGPDTVALDTDLRRALERGEIEMHYQPIMRLTDGSVAGFEALARWRHPERGLIEPGDFIPHAEESGLIIPLGRMALRRAVEDLARWQQYFAMTPPLFVSVNVAWRQIADEGFPRELSTILRNAGIADRTLKLEITETAVMKDADAAEKALKRLRALGAGLAVDDFGTGHSSLSHLKRFPFEFMKIDRSFLTASAEKQGAKILQSMIKLGRELELGVVMEGVESEEDAKRLRAMGCEYAQGFLFGAPIPGAEVAFFIAMTYAR
jgi:diguanylate cyclase (GGDEF)-like protein